jgi:hypothetical protein
MFWWSGRFSSSLKNFISEKRQECKAEFINPLLWYLTLLFPLTISFSFIIFFSSERNSSIWKSGLVSWKQKSPAPFTVQKVINKMALEIKWLFG